MTPPEPTPEPTTPEPTAPATSRFGPRLLAAMEQHGPLCVGVDPHPHLLGQWDLPDSPEGLRRFCDTVVAAVGGRVAAVKPQSAFFERHGSAGVAVLEQLLADLRQAGTLSLLDVKRGDIGSTMGAYAAAYLREGAPLAADAITVTPYLGFGSLQPAIETAATHGRGLFVLVLTSNPEAGPVQQAGDPSVAATVAAQVATVNAGASPVGDVGTVIGATVGDALPGLGIDPVVTNGIILAPGVGAQGATLQDVAAVFGAAGRRVLVPVSRGILSAGPATEQVRGATEQLAQDLVSELWT